MSEIQAEKKDMFYLPFRMGAFAGPFGVGKTLACLDLLVMAHTAGVSKDDLLVIDTHGSVSPYILLNQYKNRFILRSELDQDKLVKLFAGMIKEKKVHKVLVIDTIEPVQDALVLETWEDPALSDTYKEKNTSFMWGRIKKRLGKLLLELLTHSTETLLVTIHTRKEFVGGKPTSREESKFLQPIKQLAQFVAILERRMNVQLPDASFFPPMGKSQFPALPPKIQEFTWNKFLDYVGKAPANWAALKKEEQAQTGLELLEKIAAMGRGEEGGGEGE